MAINVASQVLAGARERLLEILSAVKGGTGAFDVSIDPFKIIAARSEPTSHIVIARNAASRVRLFDNPVYCSAFLLLAGPQEDGITANVGNVFFGGEEVSVVSGIRVVPGAQLDSSSFPQMPLFDLSRFYFHIVNAADAVRALYWS